LGDLFGALRGVHVDQDDPVLGGEDPDISSSPHAGAVREGPMSEPTLVLPPREAQILERVAEGQTNREIGTALGLSMFTVKSHLARIARKFHTGDRAHMVALALRAGATT
jgi:DNA-binding CsgD family transcriptional regulator